MYISNMGFEKMSSQDLENLPTFQKHKTQYIEVRIALGLLKFLQLFGLFKNTNLVEAEEQLSEAGSQLEQITKIPGRFNKLFIQRGWVAYESFDLSLLAEAVKLAEEGSVSTAEEKLIEYYDGDHISFWIRKFCHQVDAFKVRKDLIEKALDDYNAGRFYACVPMLLILLDGIVNDVNPDQKSGSTANVKAWDSVVGHSSSFQKLYSEVIHKTRTKTNSKEVTIPYRNGILHGRDLNYVNKSTAAKAWGALFAAGDWAIALKTENKRYEVASKKAPSLKEVLSTVSKNAEIRKKLDEWQPRVIAKDYCPIDITNKENLDKGTAEYAFFNLITNCMRKNYGEIAKTILLVKPDEIKRKAGEYRKLFENSEITGCIIQEIEDRGLSATNISAKITYKWHDEDKEIVQNFLMVHENDNGDVTFSRLEDGRWKVHSSSLYFLHS